MISVVLDTNILHQEGLSSRNMQLLHRLIEASHVGLYVPEIVMREFLTKKVSESLQELQDARIRFQSLKKNIGKGRALHVKADKALELIASIRESLEDQILEDFNKWIEVFSVTILPFKTDCMKEVMDDYFAGGGVYRKAKHRDDIPDAIINVSIKELLADKPSLTILIKDGVFKNYLEKIPNITVIDSLPNFLDLEGIRVKIDELDKLSARTEEVKAYLNSDSFTENLLTYFTQSKNIIENIFLEESAINIENKLITTSFGEQINYPISNHVSNLSLENPTYLGDDFYSVEISFTTLATLNFCADYFYYMEFEDEPTLSLGSMNGDGICDLSIDDYFRFHGFIEVHIPEGIDMKEVEKAFNILDLESGPITIDLQIESAETFIEN